MATIKINNLNLAGSDLLNDSESYLIELSEEDINITQGGFRFLSSFPCLYRDYILPWRR
ncbi:hypothetical protein [Nostoc sp. C052]|uniref:hypothetical protein n=1 Tax=Nostoc sp. C052 TaxID=2576902 RepID=UPI0015C32ABD|nr:hypothetical protein [Nostoc sp. C052]